MSRIVKKLWKIASISTILLIFCSMFAAGNEHNEQNRAPKIYQAQFSSLGTAISGTTSNGSVQISSPILRSVPSKTKNSLSKNNLTIPIVIELLQNFPNPFNPETQITVHISAESRQPEPVSLTVFNLAGQKVRRLFQGEISSGTHHFIWDGKNDRGSLLASGVYLYVLQGAGYSLSRKMLFLK